MVPGVADALIRLPRWPRLPQRGDAAAKGFRLFREQPVGQAFGALEMFEAARCDQWREPRSPRRQRLMRRRECLQHGKILAGAEPGS